MNEFILGVDLDGVCGQHTEIFREIVARELNIAEESLPLDRSWDFREWGFGPDDFERLHRIATKTFEVQGVEFDVAGRRKFESREATL